MLLTVTWNGNGGRFAEVPPATRKVWLGKLISWLVFSCVGSLARSLRRPDENYVKEQKSPTAYVAVVVAAAAAAAAIALCFPEISAASVCGRRALP